MAGVNGTWRVSRRCSRQSAQAINESVDDALLPHRLAPPIVILKSLYLRGGNPLAVLKTVGEINLRARGEHGY
jgi:hypothetical protein